jgi:hypothetical protein
MNWPQDSSIVGWFTSLPGRLNAAKTKGIRSLIILVCWSIWRERNARIFDGKEKSSVRLVSEIQDEAILWVKAALEHSC